MPLKKFLHFEPLTADEQPANYPLGNICADCIFGSQQSLLCYKSGWDNCKGSDFEPRDKGFWGRVCANLVQQKKNLEQKLKNIEVQFDSYKMVAEAKIQNLEERLEESKRREFLK